MTIPTIPQIKILIADDELPARGELKYELSTIPNVKIVGECSNGKSVLDFLKTHPNVDLIFLDIEMPVMNGLETAKKIGEMDIPAKIVFICTEKSDCSLFYTTKGIITSKITLRDSESLLEPVGFFRTHKGYIVNLSMIQEIHPQDNGTLLLSMDYFSRDKVPVSRHYLKDFKAIMHMK